jgi:hypothetical protein
VITVNGSPRPQNQECQRWGALIGKAVSDPNPKQNQSFGKVGKEILYQFSEARVAKLATRFTGNGATVVLNTTAAPDWLRSGRLVTSVSPTNIFDGGANAQRNVARYLREQGTSGNSMTVNKIATETGVSVTSVRKARDTLVSEGWVQKNEKQGRQPDEYLWVV